MLFIAFTLYLILFLSLAFAFGLNSVRIAWKTSSNPKIFTLLFPLLINVLFDLDIVFASPYFISFSQPIIFHFAALLNHLLRL